MNADDVPGVDMFYQHVYIFTRMSLQIVNAFQPSEASGRVDARGAAPSSSVKQGWVQNSDCGPPVLRHPNTA